MIGTAAVGGLVRQSDYRRGRYPYERRQARRPRRSWLRARLAISHRSTTNAASSQPLSFPTHISLPPCSRPSRTSPAGAAAGCGRPSSLTAAARASRTIVRVGTEECSRGQTKECQQTGGHHAVSSHGMIPNSHPSTKRGRSTRSLARWCGERDSAMRSFYSSGLHCHRARLVAADHQDADSTHRCRGRYWH